MLINTKKSNRIPLVFVSQTINADAGYDIYSETHDRRILSNYFLLSATRGFSAFQPPCGHENDIDYVGVTYPTWKQKHYFESIYSYIDNEDQDKTSLPFHYNEETINTIKGYISIMRERGRGYNSICNGNKHVNISNIRNRLLK